MLSIAYSSNQVSNDEEGKIMKMFTAKVKRFNDKPGNYIDIPFNCETEFGGRGKIKVTGTINGEKIKSNILSHEDGGYHLLVTRGLRVKGNIHIGDEVAVALQKDESVEHLHIPPDFSEAIKKDREVSAFFHSLDAVHQRQYIRWIDEVKREDTRQKRIQRVVHRLLNKQKLK